MAEGLNLKERMSFDITFARLWYGNGPYDEFCRQNENKEKTQEEPTIFLELKGGHYKLRKLVGNRPITARIHRHPTGQELTGTGEKARGQMDIGEIQDEGRKFGYVDIFGLLPTVVFDNVALGVIMGGRDVLSHMRLHIGLKDERERIDFDYREGPLNDTIFLLSDIAITFEIGEKYEENADSE